MERCNTLTGNIQVPRSLGEVNSDSNVPGLLQALHTPAEAVVATSKRAYSVENALTSFGSGYSQEPSTYSYGTGYSAGAYGNSQANYYGSTSYLPAHTTHMDQQQPYSAASTGQSVPP